MLVLNREVGESIILVLPDGQEIKVTVIRCKQRKALRLGVTAPRGVLVDREEVLEQRREKARLALADRVACPPYPEVAP